MRIPLEIQMTKDPDGSSHFKAIISFQDAIADSSQSQKLIQIQTEYAELIDTCQKLLKRLRSNRELRTDSYLQWELADRIYSFIKRVEKDNYAFANVSEALSRDLELSKRRLNYLIEFRTFYPEISQVSKRINWSKYQEMLDIRDATRRKICEKRILSGEIKTDAEIRAFKRSQRHR
jgi:hypothetical protein